MFSNNNNMKNTTNNSSAINIVGVGTVINGDIISFNASSIFDGTLDVSIGKFSGIDNVLSHWTGSENNGDAQFHRCNSWSASSGYEGQYATMSVTNTFGLYGTHGNCGTERRLLCICY